jgi:hypothetical protein
VAAVALRPDLFTLAAEQLRPQVPDLLQQDTGFLVETGMEIDDDLLEGSRIVGQCGDILLHTAEYITTY